MKRIFKYMIVVTAMVSCLPLMAGNTAKNSFTVRYYDHVFNHVTPSSGNYYTKVEGTGSMEPFTEAFGSFEAFPIDGTNVKIVQEGYSEACGLSVKIKSVGIANIAEGTYEVQSAEVTLINTKTGLSVTTSDLVATGNYDPTDFDSLVIDLTGAFDDSFKPNKFKGCNTNPGENNGFGNGDQDAPGKSGAKNNAENAAY